MKIEDVKIGQRVMIKSCEQGRGNLLEMLFGVSEQDKINTCKGKGGFFVAELENDIIYLGDKTPQGGYERGWGSFYAEELELLEDVGEIPFIQSDKRTETDTSDISLAALVVLSKLLK